MNRPINHGSGDPPICQRLERSVTDTTAFCPQPIHRNPDGPEAARIIRALVKAGEALLVKMEECAPHVDSAFLHMKRHGGPYTGPNWSEERKSLAAALLLAQSGQEKLEPQPSPRRDEGKTPEEK